MEMNHYYKKGVSFCSSNTPLAKFALAVGYEVFTKNNLNPVAKLKLGY